MQLQQIDQHALNEIDALRLKQYNKLLKEQLSELDREVLLTEDRFIMTYGISTDRRLTPDMAAQSLRAEIVHTQEDIANLTSDLAMFSDIKMFKRWLREMKKRVKATAQAYEEMGLFPY
jgi:hypothetical protein